MGNTLCSLRNRAQKALFFSGEVGLQAKSPHLVAGAQGPNRDLGASGLRPLDIG